MIRVSYKLRIVGPKMMAKELFQSRTKSKYFFNSKMHEEVRIVLDIRETCKNFNSDFLLKLKCKKSTRKAKK